MAEEEMPAEGEAPPEPVQDTRVVIWTTERGNVAVSRPALGVAVDAAFLARCPPGALVVEAASLPDSQVFFDAWRLVDGVIAVDLVAARAIRQQQLNDLAMLAARQRADRAAIGLPLAMSAEAFQAALAEKRAAIAATADVTALQAVALDDVAGA